MGKMENVYVISAKPGRLADLIPGAVSLGDKTTVLFVGDKADAGDVFGLGANSIYTFEKQDETIFEDYAASMASVIKEGGNSMVLLPADRRGKAMAAKLGVALGAPVVNEVTSISVNGATTLKHLVYGGLAVGEEVSSADVIIATIGSGVFETVSPMPGKSGESNEGVYIAPSVPIKLLGVRPHSGSSVDLGSAKRVVGVGRGFAKEEDISLARELAAAIDAEMGCSRPVAETEGWMERGRYIGVSGQMLSADIYFMLGISGQIQHMVGANGSKTIIAVNKDKNAPIFRSADYGIVGDIYKVIPAVTKALKGK